MRKALTIIVAFGLLLLAVPAFSQETEQQAAPVAFYRFANFVPGLAVVFSSVGTPVEVDNLEYKALSDWTVMPGSRRFPGKSADFSVSAFYISGVLNPKSCYFRTRYVRWTTPGASTTSTHSRSTGSTPV